MALAPVEKVYIITATELKEEVLNVLQEAGVLQLEEVEKDLELNPVPPAASSLEPILFRLRQVIRFFSPYKKTGLAEKWLKPKPVLSRQERQAILARDWSSFLQPLEALETQHREVLAELKLIEKEKEMVLPWKNLDIPVEELKPTSQVELKLVNMPRSRLAELATWALDFPLWYQLLHEDKKTGYLFFLIDNEALAEVEDKLKEWGASFFSFPESLLKKAKKGEKTAELINNLENEAKGKKKKLLALEEEIKAQSAQLPELLIALDVLENEQEKIQAHSRVAQTEKTAFIQGWASSSDLHLLKERLASLSSHIEILHRSPVEGEEPPVVLKNPPPVQPFEIITRLYGHPRPGAIDPTRYLAPFFFLFVGLCVSEAGYGLIVALLSLLFQLKARPKGSALLFSRLLFLLGLSTIILGTLMGGWFGFPIKQLLILDPLNQPVSFLLLALALGFIQVWFGTLLKAISYSREKQKLAPFLTQIGWLILLPSVVLFGLKKITLAGYSSLLGALLIILFTNPKRNPVVRLLAGLYGLYDVSKYLGDVLSYSRLLALGLSTSVIAMVVNTLCQTALRVPIVGWIAVPVIFLGGHLFNLAISFLGGFVHSMRLQFVEFFTKFYESGGKPLRPLTLQGKYVEFERR